jgi:hypothetical protein
MFTPASVVDDRAFRFPRVNSEIERSVRDTQQEG